MEKDSESIRLREARAQKVPWKKWGPYLSERQRGTVREDNSEQGAPLLQGYGSLCPRCPLLAGCLITKRERPENLARARAHHSEDTKVVIRFSEVLCKS